MPESESVSSKFDFEAHTARATEEYRRLRPLYEEFSAVVEEIVRQSLKTSSIRVASFQSRAKSFESFRAKVATPSEADENTPKYADPMKDLTDLAGVRVITFFPRDTELVDADLQRQFEVLEKIDKAAVLLQEEKLGYSSLHFIVSLTRDRLRLPEYSRYRSLKAEIQVRTILQHAWAEIEHDIQYKSLETSPAAIKRRFMTLAGLLEVADREFQAVQDEDEELRRSARQSVAAGQLDKVEITPDALKTYLDAKLGEDGRMREGSYEWFATLLRRLGYTNLQQVDDCIAGYNDGHVSRTIWGSRMGQTTRFEGLLLAGMGDGFINNHPWKRTGWFSDIFTGHLKKLEAAGVPIRGYQLPTEKQGA